MTEQERIAGIEDSLETGEKRIINYNDDKEPKSVKRIPIKFLLYNPHNGRIRSYTKSYESTFHALNPENEQDRLIIEQFLYDSAVNRNEKTLESLDSNGQQESGIVTKDGVIIDGNRRAMLLKMISNKKEEEGYFNAIVLPDKLRDNEKNIVTLETSYQMGVDSKVDYNPIEKYIRCSELKERHGYSTKEIADIMTEDEKKIIEWLNILGIMEEYLDKLGSPRVYTRLEKKEGHFVDLNTYLKSYSKPQHNVNWSYSSDDIVDLKTLYFAYTRLGMPVQRTRVIARLTSSNSFFCHKDIWEDFKTDFKGIISTYAEPKFQEIKKQNQEKSNEDIIRNLDDSWKSHVGKELSENLTYYEGVLTDRLELYAPIKVLRKVFNSLGQIDQENLSKSSNKKDLESILLLIQKKVSSFINTVSNNPLV